MPPKVEAAGRRWSMRWRSGSGAARHGRKPSTDAATVDWRKHWAFQPVAIPTPPVHADDRWSRSAIDRFVWTQLREKGLTSICRGGQANLDPPG